MTVRAELDGATLREAMFRFHDALQEHREELNSLNVYPVPDGDTGTNMSLTQQAVRDELMNRDGADLGEVAAAVARASLMGARGNSGVILAQALRGLVGTVRPGQASMDAAALAGAMQRAASEAYRAVARPARGTILDVLADAARAATAAAGEGADVEGVASAALDEAREALARTRDILPELREAGVVDAGARGVVLFFDALRSAVTGEGGTVQVGPFGPIGRSGVEVDGAIPSRFKFEVQYLLDAEDGSVQGLRRGLADIGDSLVVVGGEGTYKVHVHTNEPDLAVRMAESVGALGSVSVTDLEGDVERCRSGQARGVRVFEEQAAALVAVAEGEGLERIFSSLGASVVRGGPGNNPSVADILRAIEAAPADTVLVLPNHENVVPAAERAAEESAKKVRVVRSLSVPQGVAAAAAFNPGSELDRNAGALEEAVRSCSWGAVARAVRNATTPAGPVREGDALGLVGDEVVVIGRDRGEIVEDVVRRLHDLRHEILTVFWGDGVSAEDASGLERRLRERYADLEIEFHNGGQRGYPYLIGLE